MKLYLKLSATALALILAPSFAAAQSLDLASLQELDDDRFDVQYQGLTIDQLDDMDVLRDGEVIGEVEEVLGDANGEIVALVIEFGGNFLGFGEEEAVVSIDQIRISPDAKALEISLTDDELAALPKWDD